MVVVSVQERRRGSSITRWSILQAGLPIERGSMMPALYFPLTLRLYGYVLRCLSDHNFTGMDLFYHIKDCWKARDEPGDLLLRPLEHGLSYKIGEWCFDAMFDLEGQGAFTDKPFFEILDPEDFMWWLEGVSEAARISERFGDPELLRAMAAKVGEIGALMMWTRSCTGSRSIGMVVSNLSKCSRDSAKTSVGRFPR
jgi:hypothetical protein